MSAPAATARTGGWTPPTARERLEILGRTRTIAVVGASSKPNRASNFVATYLLSTTDYQLYFVNPTETEILGHPVYPSLAALPVVPDLVETFRRGDALAGVLDETLAVGAKTLWLQLGLWDSEIAQRGHEAGIEVVMNRCVKIEHARFHGGLHLGGFDTGVIDSRRGGHRSELTSAAPAGPGSTRAAPTGSAPTGSGSPSPSR